MPRDFYGNVIALRMKGKTDSNFVEKFLTNVLKKGLDCVMDNFANSTR